MKTPLRELVLLGVLIISAAAVAITPDNQVVIDSPNKQPQRLSTFDSAEDIVDQWAENGRRFITRNGQTCMCPHLERLGEWRIPDLNPSMRVATRNS